jgi:hypothetical protein
VGGTFSVDLEMRIDNYTTDRTLNSLTADITYPSSLTALAGDVDSNWFGNAFMYETSVSKLSGFYRVLITGNNINQAPDNYSGQTLDGNWFKVVTLSWQIGTVTNHQVSIDDETDAAAYFANYQNNPEGQATDWENTPTPPSTLLLASKLFLEGPYNGSDMNTDINGLIPTTSPYIDQRSIGSVHADATDWLNLEVKSSSDGATVSQKSILLKKNGQFMQEDGTENVSIYSIEGDKNYYLVIRHRNHLDVMSSSAVALNGSSANSYDFTTALSQYHTVDSDAAKDLGSGVWGMIAGDPNNSGAVNATDYLEVKNNIGSSAYSGSDNNLNGAVNATDYLVVKPNIGNSTQVQ